VPLLIIHVFWAKLIWKNIPQDHEPSVKWYIFFAKRENTDAYIWRDIVAKTMNPGNTFSA